MESRYVWKWNRTDNVNHLTCVKNNGFSKKYNCNKLIWFEEFSDIKFDRGIVGMARTQNPNSANSQFFVMFDAGYFLNGKYTVVGKVISGMKVVDQIKIGEGPNGAVLGVADSMVSVESYR